MKHRFGPSSSRRRDRAVQRALLLRRALLVSALAGPLGIAAAFQATAVQAQPAKPRPAAKGTHPAAATPTPVKRHLQQHTQRPRPQTSTPTPTHRATRHHTSAPRPAQTSTQGTAAPAKPHPHRHHSSPKPSLSQGSGTPHASSSGS